MSNIRFESYIGQRESIERIQILIEKAKRFGEPLPHLLISGPAGCGKQTFATAIANELGVAILSTDGRKIKKAKELITLFTQLKENSILVVRNCEDLSPPTVDCIESAITKYVIDIILGEGRSARTLNLSLKPFACFAISELPLRVSPQIRDNTIPFAFDAYSRDQIVQIVIAKCRMWGPELEKRETISSALLERIIDSVDGSISQAVSVLKKLSMVSDGEITEESLRVIGHSLESTFENASPEQRRKVLQIMRGDDFEIFVAERFRKRGFTAELTRKTGDHGIDLVLSKSGSRGFAQCKCWRGVVGEPEIRDFYGAMCDGNAQFGFFVTAGEFSSLAKNFASGKNIKLVDINCLTTDIDWL